MGEQFAWSVATHPGEALAVPFAGAYLEGDLIGQHLAMTAFCPASFLSEQLKVLFNCQPERQRCAASVCPACEITSREEDIWPGEVPQKRRIQRLASKLTYKLAARVADLALMKL